MKAMVNFLMAGLAGGLVLNASSVRADLEVSAGVSIHAVADFDAPLAPQGAWVEVGSYGRCWRPAGIAVGWRPYAYGRWVWTDCGWYWESDEPWAWACYHYGWWVYDPVFFWVWVPGIEWGPAWVSWRVGGGYIGWAPLPPRGVRVAVSGPEFAFVAAAHFQDPLRPGALIVNNPTIVKQTTVINNITRESRSVGGASPQRVVVNPGPGREVVQKATGKEIATVPIQEVARKTPAPAKFGATPSASPKNAPISRGEGPKPAREMGGATAPGGKGEGQGKGGEQAKPGTQPRTAPAQNPERPAPPAVSRPAPGKDLRKQPPADGTAAGGATTPGGKGEGRGKGGEQAKPGIQPRTAPGRNPEMPAPPAVPRPAPGKHPRKQSSADETGAGGANAPEGRGEGEGHGGGRGRP